MTLSVEHKRVLFPVYNALLCDLFMIVSPFLQVKKRKQCNVNTFEIYHLK